MRRRGTPARSSVRPARSLSVSPSAPLHNQFLQIEQQARVSVLAQPQPSIQSPPSSSLSLVPTSVPAAPIPDTSNIAVPSPLITHPVPSMTTTIPPPFSPYKDTDDQDIENWLDTYESWCDLNGWADEKKVRGLMIYLGTDDLKSYYRSLKDAATIERPVTWASMKDSFILKYRVVRNTETLMSSLISCKQRILDRETVSGYTKRFTLFSNKVPVKMLDERTKVAIYIANLDPRIGSKLKIETKDGHTTLTQAEAEAKRIEELNQKIDEINTMLKKTAVGPASSSTTITETRISPSASPTSVTNAPSPQPPRVMGYRNNNYQTNNNNASNDNHRYYNNHSNRYSDHNYSGNTQDIRRPSRNYMDMANITCHKCQQKGHLATQCPQRPPFNRNWDDRSSSSLVQSRTQQHRAIIQTQSTPRSTAMDNSTMPADTGYIIPVSIEGSPPIHALLDSGATVSVISQSAYQSLSHQPELFPYGIGLNGVDGTVLEPLGVIQVVISVNGICIPRSVSLVVLPRTAANTSILLGHDFINEHLSVIKPKERQCVLKYSDTPIAFASGMSGRAGVYVITKHIIPPQCSVQLRVRLSEPQLANASTGNNDATLFEPLPVDGVTMPPVLLNTNDQERLTVTINNISNTGVTLERNTQVGETISATVVPMSTLDINQLVDDYTEDEEDVPPSADSMELAPGLEVGFSSNNMNQNQRSILFTTLRTYINAFASHPSRTATTNIVEHAIDTGDARPVYVPPYRLGPHITDNIQSMVDEMLVNGIIVESSSPWSSPVLLVKKKDGSYRFCIDLRKLNSITKRDVYPLPRIDDVLDALGKAKYFSSLDLQSGYWQVRLNARDREKTAFSTVRGHYEFLVMPFGLTNAPATFQRLMDRILRDCQSFCLVYIDDIIIFSSTFDDHMDHIAQVLQRLIVANLVVKPSKCLFLKERVHYLGHIITPGYIAPDPDKIAAVASFPVPHSVKTLQSFLGLINYYRRFIKELSIIAEPLYRLLKKNTVWAWTDIQQQVFEVLKTSLTSAPLMRLPDFDLPFILHTDANNTGLGAVLSQIINEVEHPIYYASKTLSAAQRNYTTTEKECQGVKWACQLFRPYLIGKHFTVYTDHAALSWLFSHKDPNSKLTRMILSLQEFSFTINHRSGPQNSNADALSRIPDIIEEEQSGPSQAHLVSAITRTATGAIVRKPVPRPQSDIYFDPRNYDLDQALALSAAITNDNASDNNTDYTDNTLSDPGISSESGRVSDEYDEYEEKEEKKEMDEEQKYESDYDQPCSASSSTSVSSPVSVSSPTHGTRSITLDHLHQEQRSDPQLIPIIQFLESGTLPSDNIRASTIQKDAEHYILLERVLHKIWPIGIQKPQLGSAEVRPVIPTSLRSFILRSFHDSPITGHLGEAKTYDRIRNRYYWLGMHRDVQSWIKTCDQCGKRKPSRQPTRLPLGQLDTPTAAFQCLGIDVLGPLPATTKGNKYILCVTDYYTRYPLAFAMSNQRANTVAKLLVEDVFLVYGFPASLLSDRGTNFLSTLLSAILDLFSIRKLTTTAYHPQTNGLTERFNSTLATMLSHYVNKEQSNWDVYLPYVLFAYRTSTQEFLNESPFYCLYGRSAQLPEDTVLRAAADRYMADESHTQLQRLRERFHTAHTAIDQQFEKLGRQRSTASSSATLPTFKTGDLVLHYVPVPTQGKSKKLSYLWQGPYMVLDIFNNGLNYRIHRVSSNHHQLINHAASKVTNVSRLKKYYPPSMSVVRRA